MQVDIITRIGYLPTNPGVYIFKDAHDNVLYVGKAKNLKSRVGSYLNNKHTDRPWIAVMMGLVCDVETIVVSNELEALILEASLINSYQPKFNIKLTDDKSYPYIKLTLKEPFPRLQVVRQRTKDGSKYFGPYISAWSARLTCEFLRRLYGIHTSNKTLPINHSRPCLNCQLEGNLCPLAKQISSETYALKVQQALSFLSGKRRSLIKDIERRMNEASNNQHYELARKLRDQLRAVRYTAQSQNVAGKNDEDFDVIAVSRIDSSAIVSLMSVRLGTINNQRQFSFQNFAKQKTGEIIRQFVINFYHNFQSAPHLILLAEEIEDQVLIEKWLSEIFGHKVEFHIPLRGEKLDFIKLAQKNSQSRLEANLLKDNRYSGLISLKELFGLSKLPHRIEAVDISNLGSSEAVGAIVCFVNGKPEKNEYRRYKIKSVDSQNDFAMIYEVTIRRFAGYNRPLPDLFIVDGGREQLKFALSGLDKVSRRPAITIALAKKPDRIFLPNKSKPVPVPRRHEGLLLLARIRDEAHRFGISYHRIRQRRKSLGTVDNK